MSEKKAVNSILGSPNAGDLPDNALKVRRNLLATSIITLYITVGNVRISPQSSFLGFKFEGFLELHINFSLVVANIYFLLHFIWYALEAFTSWRLRVSGTRDLFTNRTDWAPETEDHCEDPKQSTLYNWWIQRKIYAADLKSEVEKIKKDIQKTSSPKEQSEQISKKLDFLQKTIESEIEVLSHQRITESLRNFDNWFQLFVRVQNLRWLLIDIVFPIFMGFWSLSTLLHF